MSWAVPLILVVLVASLLGTLFVGAKPRERDYEQKTRRNYKNYLIIYAVGTLLFFLGFFLVNE
ncbi:hypothetical protein LOK74_00920 [Brevibacillus humidisoli]|uniref:hypothetical protein n=1 Tax=Brevibacillus humidisoli TaxID=2895522 RepID=UPI001E5B748A|nr:hypothetical protein [Brevibacillus humidisoli]UFJ41156.1 hypothetical protein LOK74_00920 [Brevibacillus humidisoli]